MSYIKNVRHNFCFVVEEYVNIEDRKQKGMKHEYSGKTRGVGTRLSM